MKKEELINVIVEVIEDKFPELIEEQGNGFSDGEEFFSISGDGIVFSSIWENHPIDKCRLSIGNTFKTREETEFAVEKLKVIHELESLGRPFKSDFCNFSIVFNFHYRKVSAGLNAYINPSFFNCFFDSEEEAKKAIEKIGRDRIKKYLFGVDE